MDSFNRFHKTIFEWESFLLRLVGHDILSKDFKLNALSFIAYALILMCFFGEIYTVMYYDPITKAMSVFVSIITIQVNFTIYFFFIMKCISKVINFQCTLKVYHVRYLDDILWLIQFIESMYKRNITTKLPERIDLFRMFSFITKYLFIGLMIIYIISMGTFLTLSIYMYYVENKIVALVPVYFPGINESTFIGYIELLIFHGIVVFLALVGIYAVDFFMVIIAIHSHIFSKLISFEFKQINIDLEEKEPEIMIWGRIRNVLQMHQELEG